jgi:hypothetical protein
MKESNFIEKGTEKERDIGETGECYVEKRKMNKLEEIMLGPCSSAMNRVRKNPVVKNAWFCIFPFFFAVFCTVGGLIAECHFYTL